MSVLPILFTEQELAPVHNGIRTFIRLLGMIYSDDPLQLKWLADEEDLKSALRSIAQQFKASEIMLGKRKYQGIDYDAPNEVKKDLSTFLLTGRDERDEALQRKRYLPMYHLVIVPVCDLFYKYDHRMQIDIADKVIEELCAIIDNTDAYGTLDDALVAQAQVRQLITEKEERRKAELNARKRRKTKRDPLAELFGLGEDETDLEEDYV